ncbi:hypothetical protein [Streptomyces spectabilis]|uniref:hypothetical protein n=1 Tax=Streptomyces spectabilis TaxID=68270 RepID=UPI003409A93D
MWDVAGNMWEWTTAPWHRDNTRCCAAAPTTPLRRTRPARTPTTLRPDSTHRESASAPSATPHPSVWPHGP